MSVQSLDTAPHAVLLELIQELLDAHLDTAELAQELSSDPAWGMHLDYLGALRRRGTALLARAQPVAER